MKLEKSTLGWVGDGTRGLVTRNVTPALLGDLFFGHPIGTSWLINGEIASKEAIKKLKEIASKNNLVHFPDETEESHQQKWTRDREFTLSL